MYKVNYAVMPDLIRHPESIEPERFRDWIPAPCLRNAGSRNDNKTNLIQIIIISHKFIKQEIFKKRSEESQGFVIASGAWRSRSLSFLNEQRDCHGAIAPRNDDPNFNPRNDDPYCLSSRAERGDLFFCLF